MFSRIAKNLPALNLNAENLFGWICSILRDAAASSRPFILSALKSSAMYCLMSAPLCVLSVLDRKEKLLWTWWLKMTVLSVHQKPKSSQKFLMTSNPQDTQIHILQNKIFVGPGHQYVETVPSWSFLILM